MGPGQHRPRQVDPDDRVPARRQLSRHDAGPDSDLDDRSGPQPGCHARTDALPPFESASGGVIAVGDAIERHRFSPDHGAGSVRPGAGYRSPDAMSVPSKTGTGTGRTVAAWPDIDAAALDAAERFVLRDARLIDRHRLRPPVPRRVRRRGRRRAAPLRQPGRRVRERPRARPAGCRQPARAGGGGVPDPRRDRRRRRPRRPARRRRLRLAGRLVGARRRRAVGAPVGRRGRRGRPGGSPSTESPGARSCPPRRSPGCCTRTVARHRWLDGATRFCRERIDAIAADGEDLDPYTARAILDFLDDVPDRDWADAAYAGVREPILATVTFDADAPGHVHLPIEYAPAARRVRPAAVRRCRVRAPPRPAGGGPGRRRRLGRQLGGVGRGDGAGVARSRDGRAPRSCSVRTVAGRRDHAARSGRGGAGPPVASGIGRRAGQPPMRVVMVVPARADTSRAMCAWSA